MKKSGPMRILVFFWVFPIFGVPNTLTAIAQEKPIVWKFANFGPMTSAFNVTAKWYFDEVEKRTKGRLKVEYHVGESLVPLKSQPDAIKSGLCQATIFVPPYYWGKTPLTTGLTYPFVLPASASQKGTFDTFKLSDMYYSHPEVTKEFAKWDCKYIFATAITQGHLIGNKPVRTVSDLRGLKIRAPGPQGDLIKEFGASPVFVPLPEFYQSVQTGLVDLFSNDFYIFTLYRVHEVSKYATDNMFMGTGMDPFLIKESSFCALPEDIQKVILQVKTEALDWVSKYYYELNKNAREECKRKVEMIYFPPEERAKMVAVGKKVCWEEYISKTEKRGLPARQLLNWIVEEGRKMGYKE